MMRASIAYVALTIAIASMLRCRRTGNSGGGAKLPERAGRRRRGALRGQLLALPWCAHAGSRRSVQLAQIPARPARALRQFDHARQEPDAAMGISSSPISSTPCGPTSWRASDDVAVNRSCRPRAGGDPYPRGFRSVARWFPVFAGTTARVSCKCSSQLRAHADIDGERLRAGVKIKRKPVLGEGERVRQLSQARARKPRNCIGRIHARRHGALAPTNGLKRRPGPCGVAPLRLDCVAFRSHCYGLRSKLPPTPVMSRTTFQVSL